MARAPARRHKREVTKRRVRRERRSVLPRRRVAFDVIKLAQNVGNQLERSFGERFSISVGQAGISGIRAGPIVISADIDDLTFSFIPKNITISPFEKPHRLHRVMNWEAGFEALAENSDAIMKDVPIGTADVIHVVEKPGVVFIRSTFNTLDDAIKWMKTYGSKYNHNITEGCPGGSPC